MARLFTSGFEVNSTTAGVEWTAIGASGTTSISTTTVRTGTYAGRVSGLASGGASGFLHQFLAVAANGPYFLRFYFRYHTAPSAANVIATLSGAATFAGVQANDACVKLSSTGTLQLFSSAVQVGSDSSALSADTWYLVEVKYDKSPAGGSQVLEGKLNGSVFATSSSLTLSRAVLAFQLGGNLFFEAQTTGDWFFDDVAFNDNNTGGTQTGYAGTGGVIMLTPNATGDVNTFATQTGGTAGSGNNFTRVKEIPPDDATTFNGSSTLNQEDLVKCIASGIGASDTVNVVSVFGRFRNSTADATAAFKFEIEKAASGTISQSSAIVPNSTTWKTNSTTSTLTFPIVLYNDPDGSAWTQATLDTMQIGYKLTTGPGTAGRRVDVTAVYAYIDYTPATTDTISVSDTSAVTELVTMEIFSSISVSDTTNMSELSQIAQADDVFVPVTAWGLKIIG